MNTRLEEIELLLTVNRSKIFQQFDPTLSAEDLKYKLSREPFLKVMELVKERTKLEIEKHEILKRTK